MSAPDLLKSVQENLNRALGNYDHFLRAPDELKVKGVITEELYTKFKEVSSADPDGKIRFSDQTLSMQFMVSMARSLNPNVAVTIHEGVGLNARVNATINVETATETKMLLSSAPDDLPGFVSVDKEKGVTSIFVLRLLESYRQSLHVFIVGFVPIPLLGAKQDKRFTLVDLDIDSRHINRLALSGSRIHIEGTRDLVTMKLDGNWKGFGENVLLVKVDLDVGQGDSKELFSFLRETSPVAS